MNTFQALREIGTSVRRHPVSVLLIAAMMSAYAQAMAALILGLISGWDLSWLIMSSGFSVIDTLILFTIHTFTLRF